MVEDHDARERVASTFRGFDSENIALAEARERAQTFGYTLASLCNVWHGIGAHIREDTCPPKR